MDLNLFTLIICLMGVTTSLLTFDFQIVFKNNSNNYNLMVIKYEKSFELYLLIRLVFTFIFSWWHLKTIVVSHEECTSYSSLIFLLFENIQPKKLFSLFLYCLLLPIFASTIRVLCYPTFSLRSPMSYMAFERVR